MLTCDDRALSGHRSCDGAVEQLAQFLKQWTQRLSVRIKQFLRTELPQYAAHVPETDAFWQARYDAFQIYAREKLEEKLQYMHLLRMALPLPIGICSARSGRPHARGQVLELGAMRNLRAEREVGLGGETGLA